LSDETEKVETMTPKQLAAELDIDPKRLRSYLRKHHTRVVEVKGTDWEITPDVADAARTRFTPKAEEPEATEAE
jgi:phage antirepressor YoqD-like protein